MVAVCGALVLLSLPACGPEKDHAEVAGLSMCLNIKNSSLSLLSVVCVWGGGCVKEKAVALALRGALELPPIEFPSLGSSLLWYRFNIEAKWVFLQHKPDSVTTLLKILDSITLSSG